MASWGVSSAAIQALLTQSALLIAARTLAIPRLADVSFLTAANFATRRTSADCAGNQVAFVRSN